MQPASYLSQCFRSCSHINRVSSAPSPATRVVAHGSRRVQQDAHFALQNDTEQSAAACSRVGGGRGQESEVVFPLQLSNTPYPRLTVCGSDVNPPGDSLCGVARMVTVQRQSRSVAWALGGQGFRYDFTGDCLIITYSLGLRASSPLMLGD